MTTQTSLWLSLLHRHNPLSADDKPTLVPFVLAINFVVNKRFWIIRESFVNLPFSDDADKYLRLGWKRKIKN